ncbi:hypothetical protein GCM10011611_03080 [Aliidongia dinghuensis]|uniref:Uncharacterized protein n=1 Tax=Aliidongia dinghuensis TaxID=1867774 RepID=A0A8J2YNS9_9PROT|nr:hypothetical protein GCM10011611_03080 [Aliidongia dinghuensis]
MRQKALELESKYRSLGLDRPEDWIRSEIVEGLPQFTRFLVLRRCWADHVAPWSQDAANWIERVDAPKDGAGDRTREQARQALAAMKSAGIATEDLGALARFIAHETAIGILNCVDEGHDPVADANAPGWALVETDATGAATGRTVVGLHEDAFPFAET